MELMLTEMFLHKSFHFTIDALGVSETIYMLKKAETYFWTRVRLLFRLLIMKNI